jgi:hypothetical protein
VCNCIRLPTEAGTSTKKSYAQDFHHLSSRLHPKIRGIKTNVTILPITLYDSETCQDKSTDKGGICNCYTYFTTTLVSQLTAHIRVIYSQSCEFLRIRFVWIRYGIKRRKNGRILYIRRFIKILSLNIFTVVKSRRFRRLG